MWILETYLIFVTGATGGAHVNFFCPVYIFTDLTRKIGNLLCKLAIHCVNFGVNFILQKFCLCKKNDKYEICKKVTFIVNFLECETISIDSKTNM